MGKTNDYYYQLPQAEASVLGTTQHGWAVSTFQPNDATCEPAPAVSACGIVMAGAGCDIVNGIYKHDGEYKGRPLYVVALQNEPLTLMALTLILTLTSIRNPAQAQSALNTVRGGTARRMRLQTCMSWVRAPQRHTFLRGWSLLWLSSGPSERCDVCRSELRMSARVNALGVGLGGA